MCLCPILFVLLVKIVADMRHIWLLTFVIVLFSSCIDEDLSKCKSKATSVDIMYTVAFDEYCHPDFGNSSIFSLHTGFWNSAKELYDESLIYKSDFPQDMLFHFSLPHDRYTHIATANTVVVASDTEPSFDTDVTTLVFSGSDSSKDTIEAFSTPIFAGRYDIDNDTCNCESHLYVVELRPLVSRLLLTVEYSTSISNLRAVVEGTQSGFKLYDTVFVSNSALRTSISHSMVIAQSDYSSLVSCYIMPVVGRFVKHTSVSTSSIGSVSAAHVEAQWFIYLFAEVGDKTVMNKYTIDYNLYPGGVFERRLRFHTDEVDVQTGVEVDLDWKPGGSHNEDI